MQASFGTYSTSKLATAISVQADSILGHVHFPVGCVTDLYDRQAVAGPTVKYSEQLSQTCAMLSACVTRAHEYSTRHAASVCSSIRFCSISFLLFMHTIMHVMHTILHVMHSTCASCKHSCLSCTPTCCRTGWRQDAKGTGRELTTDLKAKKSIAKLSSSGQLRLPTWQVCQLGCLHPTHLSYSTYIAICKIALLFETKPTAESASNSHVPTFL